MLTTIGGIQVTCDGKTVSWTSGMEVDCDGAPNAYAPEGRGFVTLDVLANAGYENNYWGLACDQQGTPYVQGADDPFPGYYVSQSSMGDGRYPTSDPRRWVDAAKVPYISVPPDLIALGVRKGDLAVVRAGTKVAGAIVADGSPRGKLGEGSFALHLALGYNPQRALPKHHLVGIDAGVRFQVRLGTASSPPWPRSTLLADLAAIVAP